MKCDKGDLEHGKIEIKYRGKVLDKIKYIECTESGEIYFKDDKSNIIKTIHQTPNAEGDNPIGVMKTIEGIPSKFDDISSFVAWIEIGKGEKNG